MAEHRVKTWSKYFQAMWNKKKTFEFRKNDRNYKVGDKFISLEWNPKTGEYTGRVIEAVITYVLEGEMDVPKGYAILSLDVEENEINKRKLQELEHSFKHGIYGNEKEGIIEAWKNGKKIGAISLECQESTITMWIKRYTDTFKNRLAAEK